MECLVQLSLLMLPMLATSCEPEPTGIQSVMRKRWLAVGDYHKTDVMGPWPADEAMPGMRTVKYCFVSAHDYDALNDPLIDAIEVWKPALSVSSLRIVPALGIGVPKTLCDMTGVKLNALIVYVASSRGSSASIGCQKNQYNHLKIDLAQIDPDRPGHLRSIIAHELGHVIGFGHEHQRLDASKHIEIACQNVARFEHFQKLISSKPLNAGDTVWKACSDFALAKRYGWYEMANLLPHPGVTSGAGAFDYSREFDYDSIMIYSSYAQSIKHSAKSKFPDGSTLRGRGADGKIFQLFPGGTRPTSGTQPDLTRVKTSEGDIARVAQLYPKDGKTVDAAGSSSKWKGIFNYGAVAAGVA